MRPITRQPATVVKIINGFPKLVPANVEINISMPTSTDQPALTAPIYLIRLYKINARPATMEDSDGPTLDASTVQQSPKESVQ